MKKKTTIIIDFDGTLIEGDLERSFMRYLLTKPEIKYKMLLLSCITLPINLIRNKLCYPSVYKSWTYILRDNIQEHIEEFLNKNIPFIQLKEQIWALLERNDTNIILLSGCHQDLLKSYLSKIEKIDKFDKIIGCTMQKDNFRVAIHPYGRAKTRFVNTESYNIGIANEKADHFYLDMCNEKIYVK